MVDLSDIALGLQAFGEGVQGRGQQFAQGRIDRRQKLDNQRRQALLLDNRNALFLLGQGNAAKAEELLTNRIAEINRLGGDPSDTMAQLNKIKAGDVKGAMLDAQLLDNTAVGKGFLEPMPQVDTLKERKFELEEKKFKFQQAKFRAEQAVETVAEVQSAKTLDDGTIIYAMKDGTRKVTDPEGQEITGREAATAIKKAVAFGISSQGARAGARTTATETAKSSIKKANEAFDRIAPIKSTIASIDKAIAAIDEGANTGAIDKFLPSVKAASVKLDTIMNELGLDVVSSTTFGALSEGELRLALSTALPTGLEPPQLKQWLIDKKAAQKKLMQGLEVAVVDLMAGDTIADLVRRGREGVQGPTGKTKTPEATTDPIIETLPGKSGTVGTVETVPGVTGQGAPQIKFLGFE